jgi:hypothetical protein
MVLFGRLRVSLLNAAFIAAQKIVEFQIRTEELPKVGNKESQARRNYPLASFATPFCEVGDAVDP